MKSTDQTHGEHQLGTDHARGPIKVRSLIRATRRFVSRRPAVAAMWLLTISVFLVTLTMFRPLTEPIMYHDEAGYLFNALTVAGTGPQRLMGAAPFYHPGYSVLIAPLMLMSQDPATRYALVMGMNALLVALLVPVAYLVARRVFKASPWIAVLAAALVAAYPSTTMLGSLAWADAAVGLATLVLILGVERTVARRSAAAAAFTGTIGAFLYLIHPRLIVHGLLLFGLAALLAFSKRTKPWTLLALLGSYVTGIVLARVLIGTLRDILWTTASPSTAFIKRVMTVEALQDIPRNMLGSGWYLLAGTIGLAAAGVGILAFDVSAHRSMFGRRVSGRTDPHDDPDAAATFTELYALLLIGGSFLLSAAFVVGPITRTDLLFYGRYNESFMPLLLIGGAVFVSRSVGGRQLWGLGVAGIAGSAAVLVMRYGWLGAPPDLPRNQFIIAAVEGWKYLLNGWSVTGIGIAATIIGVVAVAVSARQPTAALILIGLVFTFVSASVWTNWRNSLNDAVTAQYTIDEFLITQGPPETLWYEREAEYIYSFYAYQWNLALTSFDKAQDPTLVGHDGGCLLSTKDEPPGPGWNLVYAEKTTNAALWSRTRGPSVGSCITSQR